MSKTELLVFLPQPHHNAVLLHPSLALLIALHSPCVKTSTWETSFLLSHHTHLFLRPHIQAISYQHSNTSRLRALLTVSTGTMHVQGNIIFHSDYNSLVIVFPTSILSTFSLFFNAAARSCLLCAQNPTMVPHFTQSKIQCFYSGYAPYRLACDYLSDLFLFLALSTSAVLVSLLYLEHTSCTPNLLGEPCLEWSSVRCLQGSSSHFLQHFIHLLFIKHTFPEYSFKNYKLSIHSITPYLLLFFFFQIAL